jgi:hypothetical protein
METLNRLVSGRFGGGRDFPGVGASGGKLSTKLSTENEGDFKIVKNQALTSLPGDALKAGHRLQGVFQPGQAA